MTPQMLHPADPQAEEPPAVLAVEAIPAPTSGRGLALSTLAVIATVYALDWAQTFVISMLLGILLAYTLNPIVSLLERIRLPRGIATVIVMLATLAALGFGGYSLRGQAQTILEQLPEAAAKISSGLARLRTSHLGAMEKVQSAATVVEKAASQASGEATKPRQVATHVVIDQPGFKLNDMIWLGSKGAAGALGQVVMVLFLTFFLLVGGNTFKRKLVRLTGPSLSNRKVTVQILDDINDSIQKYLFMLVATNVLVGLLVWVAFSWMGLENAGAWAVAAGLLHVIPYLGPGVTAAATGMAAFMQFDSVPMALLAAGTSLAIATVVGTFVTTWMTGRIAKMNAAAVFTSLLFWGWLWGVWGMLLSIPIVVIMKVVSEHVDELAPVAELLGD